MDALIFSLNTTVPVFLLMVFGYILKQTGFINDEFIRVSNKVNFKITLPCLLFLDIYDADITHNFDLRFVAFCAIVTTIAFFAIWGIARVSLRDKSMVGAFVQASYRSSAAVLGAALIENIYGDSGMAPLMIIGAVPLFNIYAVLVLCRSSTEREERSVRGTLKNVFTNPIILAILAGLIYTALPFGLPTIARTSLSYLSRTATPLAVLAIGGSFEGRKALAKIKPTMAAAAIKLAILPAIFLPVAVWMGFTGSKLVAILIMLGSPTTPSCYIMAKNMHNDDVLTSSIIMVTTVLSAFSLTVILYILRSMGLV
ncbi:MAG: AEC family transporter [Lachnospiraceae bacterium]|nr:AEC family transporter [Lachnospiraceae bacterium]